MYLVLTKSDKLSQSQCDQVKQDITSALTTSFGVKDLSELIVDGKVFDVSALAGLHGVVELRRHLCQHLASDPHSHVGVPLPSVYLRLAETAHTLEHRVVMRRDELRLLASQQLALSGDKNFDRALEFVHETGTALWFAEHGRLREWVFLQPKFLIDILACIQRQQHKGKKVIFGRHGSRLQTAAEKLAKEGILELDCLAYFCEGISEPAAGGNSIRCGQSHAPFQPLVISYLQIDYSDNH